MSSAKPESPAESVRVNIFGQTYSLRSAGGVERVLRVAGLVDERMREIASHLAVHDAAKVAVLAALNLADELELVREQYEREIESLLTAAPQPPEGSAVEAPAPAAGVSPDGAPRGEAREGGKADAAAETRGAAGAGGREDDARRGDETPIQDETPIHDEETPRRDDARRSWFDEIFDSEFSSGGSGRLSSQVSSRLKRLRQTTRGGTIREGGADGGERG
jgi:cell division protein ZapA